ncbi:hypothetical protein KGF56_001258 [Candida oxycetoniae]|uniref:DUF1749-domain-containing protein n=1 Tax=Candida oxycetoniae TaxID=497107 RepID=A0AAI9WZG6_9ASCO|nr:uncharacterized protein KGF56_001258 [Candida oxycetoniae]KAI3406039.2 hypothetical protein KGF56_001258 [Candida oxycetoniae]
MSLSAVPPQRGIVHTFGFNLTAFEFIKNPDSKDVCPNIVLFVGGLGNGLLNVPYLPRLAEVISDGGEWNLIQVLLGSAYNGWGVSSLQRDSRQIQKAIEYFKSEAGGKKQKIVIMGHSTGCQNAIHYLTKTMQEEAQQIQGAILQAPVSDQEALRNSGKSAKLEKLLEEVYDEYIAKGRENEILPEKYKKVLFNTPVTAYRFYSLACKRGDDDYFSSYLTESDFKETFGKVTKPLLVLYSGSDQFVPAHVDKKELLERWQNATPTQYWSKYSQIIPGATHELSDEGSDEGVIDTLTQAVKSFISEL